MKLNETRLATAKTGPWYSTKLPVPIEFTGECEFPSGLEIKHERAFEAVLSPTGIWATVYLCSETGYKTINLSEEA